MGDTGLHDTADLGTLRLLASAIAGQPVDVAALADSEASYTDGVTIFIPRSESPQSQIEMLCVQASLIAAGSLAPGIVGQLRRHPALLRRYVAVEGQRALRELGHLLPDRVRWLIDADVARGVDSPAMSLAMAAGPAVVAEAPTQFGTIRPKDLAVQRRDKPSVGREEPPDVPGRAETAQPRELSEYEDRDGPSTHFFSSPVGGGGFIGRLLKKLFGEGRLGGEGSPGADSPTRWMRWPTEVGGRPVLSAARAPTDDGGLGAPRGHRYPEWDVGRHRYRPDWCTVVEVEPTVDDQTDLSASDPARLRRALGRLGVELERQHRQPQGDDVDVDAAVEMYVQLAAGRPPDEAVYIDTVRRRRDLSILVLLDVSGSAGEPGSRGQPVHVHQSAAAATLALALHQLGDRVAVYGFRSQGRSAVHLLPVKRFDETFGALALRRLGGLGPGGYTRLGAAIRHGSNVLERRGGTSRRLLVVLTDGFAYDHGYEPAYGEADASRALAEARRRGIGCLCLSMGTNSDPAALRRVFGATAHAVVPLVEQLPVVVGPLFRDALRSADTQRRLFLAREHQRERVDLYRRPA